MPGELCFANDFTARGYVKRPDLTAEKFCAAPISEFNWRMYKTGDLVKWSVDGELVFCGRVDSQIKLRGFRVELGEIESVIRSYVGVKEAVVVLHGDNPSNHKLVGYVTPDTVSVEALTVHCKRTLAEYMVPSVIMALAQFPRTPRDKLDRERLPEPPAREVKLGNVDDPDFEQAMTPTELTVERVWKEVLGTDESISVTADFLSVGGNSLLAGRCSTLIAAATNTRLVGTAMYTNPTIRSIAALVDTLPKRKT